MADTFKRAGALFRHGTRMAGRLEVREFGHNVTAVWAEAV